MGRVIAIANQKGGVGKTTTAVNVAAGMAISEIPTLLIDMDPQSNASVGLGVDFRNTSISTYEVLIDEVEAEQAVVKTEIPLLDVIPSSPRLVGASIELVNMMAREYMLKTAIEDIRNKYRYIFIDCPPSLDLLTINSLASADSVLIPIQCEYYALEGLSQLLQTIRLVQRSLNQGLQIEGVLITMYDSRLNLSRQVADEVREYFKEKVYQTVVRRNVRLGEAPSHGKPIILYDGASFGTQDYMDLVVEMMKYDSDATG